MVKEPVEVLAGGEVAHYKSDDHVSEGEVLKLRLELSMLVLFELKDSNLLQ